MALTRKEVEHIAHLARLELREDEVAGVVAKLSGIMDFVDQLKQADLGDVAPMAHPLDLPQRLRADEVTETDHRDLYQRNAPAVDQGLYLVPRVIE
jgi:aspartyl-tRNA(Asn)/glutamyl-tRNA(Gln) amidotransferase subunit C